MAVKKDSCLIGEIETETDGDLVLWVDRIHMVYHFIILVVTLILIIMHATAQQAGLSIICMAML